MNCYIATGILMFQATAQYSAVLVLMNHHHVYSDLWQIALPCKVTMSHTPSLLHLGAHEGHGLQVETAEQGTLAVNHEIGWLHYEEWWSYQWERQTVLFEMCVSVHTGWWVWTVIIVSYLLSEVEVLQSIHKFQDQQGTGLSHPLQLRMLPSLLFQFLCSAVAAVQICNTLGHPWLPSAGRSVVIKQPTHPGKQADSCQDLEWIKLIENSKKFTHSKWNQSTLPVANANEELLGQLWKRFLCNRCHPCDVTYLCALESRDWNRHTT